MPQCTICKHYFKNIYNHISQGLCCNDSAHKEAVVLIHGENGVIVNSSAEQCCDVLHEFVHHDDNETCNRLSKRLKTTTTAIVTTRNSTDEPDELVDREFEHFDDFDDDVSIQMSNTDLNNQSASWQQRNDKTETLFESDSDSETEDGIVSLACHVTFANNQDVEDNNLDQVWGNVHQVNENFSENVSQEDHLLIRLTSLCCQTNVPLYLADEIVEIFCDETERGLVLNSLLLSKRRTFLKCMCSRFPSPKAQSIHIGIEGIHPLNYNYQRGFCFCKYCLF